VPSALMRRVFSLAASFESPCPLDDFDSFLARTGLSEQLQDPKIRPINKIE
jgi:hypothetical protein